MFERKARSRRPFKPPTEKVWNDIVESADHYSYRRSKNSRFASGHQINPAMVLAKNVSGAGVARGSVLELTTQLTTTVKPESLVYEATTPATNGTAPYGIVLRQMPDDAMDSIQLCGVCIGLVDVTDTSHRFAVIVSGDVVLASAPAGPIALLSLPLSTGEQELGIWIGTGLMSCGYPAKVTSQITAASDSGGVRTLGVGLADFYTRDTATDELIAIAAMVDQSVFNTTTTVGPINSWIQVKPGPGGDWYWDVAECA